MVPNQSAAETKKAICRSFTNVVKASRLSGSIDPKAFFMMLNANFPVLHRDGRIDLTPIWEALVTNQPPEALYSVFLKFAESADQVGVGVDFPPAVALLTDDQRANELASFAPGTEPQIVTGDSGSFPSLDSLPSQVEPEELRLATGDLKPIIPEETRRQITQYVVYAVKAAPVGQLVDAHQLAFLVDSDFEQLFDGQRFDFNPILEGLRKLGDFKDTDVFVAIVRLEQKLHGMGHVLMPVALDVNPEDTARLLEEAEKQEKQAAQDAANAVAQTRNASASQVPEIGDPVPEEDKTDDKKTRKAKSLEKYNIKAKPSRTATIIRYAVLLTIAAGIGAAAFFTRPNRPLDPTPYGSTVPLKTARLENGSLVGTLDDERWWKLTTPERKRRFKDFEVAVRSNGFAGYMQIRDAKDRVVIGSSLGGRIVPAKFLVYGSQDGTISEEQREEMTKEAPPDAQRVMKQD